MRWNVLRWRADAAATFVILVFTIAGTWGLLSTETAVVGDAATYFYPWYSLLGEGLRSGDVPGWNPHQFSGAPFAADLQSGWTYLPAMLLFAFLPLAAAAGGFAFFHLLLAGLSTYALARGLGISIPGALLAAVAYEFGGLLYPQTTCCFLYVSVMSWLPLAFLGVELATRSTRRLERVSWWGVSGLALSQILASWTGQGAYYALLALGGYVGYRTLLDPPSPRAPGLRSRLLNSALHGGAILAFGFGLAAAGLLPRLEYNALSNLAGGYPGEEGLAEAVSGWEMRDWGMLLEAGSSWYVGVAVLALALTAPLIAQRRFAVPYFAVLAPCAFVLSLSATTPLHTALYWLLPYFERLHPHRPERVMVVFYLAAALLAGAALSELGRRATREPRLLVPPTLAAALLMVTSILLPPVEAPVGTASLWETLSFLPTEDGEPALAGPLLALAAVLVLVLAPASTPTRFESRRGLALASLALLAFVDLFGAGRAAMAELPDSKGLGMADLEAYYEPAGAAGFLRSVERPFRYASYAGEEWGDSAPEYYSDPATRALEDYNPAMTLGLEQIQGYNPIRVARYDEYVTAMNGYEQNYHYAAPYEEAFSSPLFDLLNTRYVVVPAEMPPEDQANLQRSLNTEEQVVYEDDLLKVIENPEALPRAWIVHSAQQVESGEEALDLLNTGQVDPEETALLEEEPPKLAQPDDPSADQASVTEHEADLMRLETASSAPGLLVLSEVYYPAWKAYVDGEPAPVYATDHLLRSVPIPAGEHTVELRYESWTLRAGMAISSVTLVALAVLVAAAVARRKSAKSGKGSPDEEGRGP